MLGLPSLAFSYAAGFFVWVWFFLLFFFFLLRKKRAIFNEINVIHDLKKQKHFPEYEVENENHF